MAEWAMHQEIFRDQGTGAVGKYRFIHHF